MNQAIIGSIVRWLGGLLSGTAIGVILASAGLFDPAVIADIVGKVSAVITSLGALGMLLWSIWQKIKAARKLNAAIIAPAAELPK